MAQRVQMHTITEAKANLSRLISEVEQWEVVVIGRAGKPVAKLVPYVAIDGPRDLSAGTWRGRVKISADFDELPADFMLHFGSTGDPD